MANLNRFDLASPARSRGKSGLLILSEAFSGSGGIQRYGRLLLKACSEISAEGNARWEAVILNDSASDVDPRYTDSIALRVFDGSRLRFSSAAAHRVFRMQPDVVLFGLLNFGPMSLILRLLSPRSEHWFVAHGIEAWTRLRGGHRAAVRRAERVLSVSDFTRRELISHNQLDPDRLVLLPCALDPVWAQDAGQVGSENRATPDDATLLTVARMIRSERYKGVEEVLKALPSVRERFPEVRYLVVGDGDDRARLQELARQLGLSGTVEFLGRIGATELARVYASASVFVMPSSREGFGIVFLEAAFFGKPSIASIAGGSPEVVIAEKTGLLIDPGDIESLSAAIIELLSSKDRREQLGRQARERVNSVYCFARFKCLLKEYLGSD